MKFLIAGLGSIGRRHLHNLIALGESDIVLLRSHRSTLPDADLPDFPVTSKTKSALAYKPDAVIISNPTSLHLDVAIPAAQAGCHLFIEKPISNNLDNTEKLIEITQSRGNRVLVGYHFRYHPGLQKIVDLLKSGTIGRPLSARAHWGEYLPGWHPWEDYRLGYSARSDLGGGVILTLSHPLDYLSWMFGQVESIWAYQGKLGDLEINVDDTAEILLQFEQPLIASVHLNYNQRPPMHYLEIIGSSGNIYWNNNDGSVHLYQPSEPTASQSELSQAKIFPINTLFNGKKPFERNDLFLEEMKHFIAVAKGETMPICSLDDGMIALRLSLVAIQSASLKRKIKIK